MSAGLLASLDYRPATAIIALGVIASLCFLYSNATEELAPPEDQGIVLGLSKAPQYANLDYMQAYRKQLEDAPTASPMPTEPSLFWAAGGQSGLCRLPVEALE